MQKFAASMKERDFSLLIAAAICLLTVAVYWPVQYHEFLLWDDYSYIVENPNVRNGIDSDSIRWAFFSSHSSNWHPLTWLSHMLDAELFGLNPAGHHWSSLLLHISNALLLFLVLRTLSGTLWRSALTAVLFSIHPLHVESVAWASERKDVLSGLFWMLTLLAYAKYSKSPEWKGYVLTLVIFAFALMSKPIVITLPFVMLLLDYWPLRRFHQAAEEQKKISYARLRLFMEKGPFLALAAVSGVITFLVQRSYGAVDIIVPLELRLTNGLVSYVSYILKMFWPSDLAFFYPHPLTSLSWMHVAGSLLFLILVTVLTLGSARNRPYLLVGWLWFLGTLAPVIGIVQVGGQAMADRYAYLPHIGILIAVVWGVAEFAFRSKALKTAFFLLSFAAVFLLALSSHQYLRYWKDGISLFSRALQVTEHNYAAHFLLGKTLERSGDIERAIRHYSEAVKIQPDNLVFRKALAHAMIQKEDYDGAIRCLEEAIRYIPKSAEMLTSLGSLLMERGELKNAELHLNQALEIKPHAEAHHKLGLLFARQSRLEESIFHYRQALAIKPRDAWIQNDLGLAFYGLKDYPKALFHLSEALKLDPVNRKLRHNLDVVRKQIEENQTRPPDDVNDR